MWNHYPTLVFSKMHSRCFSKLVDVDNNLEVLSYNFNQSFWIHQSTHSLAKLSWKRTEVELMLLQRVPTRMGGWGRREKGTSYSKTYEKQHWYNITFCSSLVFLSLLLCNADRDPCKETCFAWSWYKRIFLSPVCSAEALTLTHHHQPCKFMQYNVGGKAQIWDERKKLLLLLSQKLLQTFIMHVCVSIKHKKKTRE